MENSHHNGGGAGALKQHTDSDSIDDYSNKRQANSTRKHRSGAKQLNLQSPNNTSQKKSHKQAVSMCDAESMMHMSVNSVVDNNFAAIAADV